MSASDSGSPTKLCGTDTLSSPKRNKESTSPDFQWSASMPEQFWVRFKSIQLVYLHSHFFVPNISVNRIQRLLILSSLVPLLKICLRMCPFPNFRVKYIIARRPPSPLMVMFELTAHKTNLHKINPASHSISHRKKRRDQNGQTTQLQTQAMPW